MPISGSDRVIVVTGLVHSGTTIVAYLLGQHPEVKLLTSGAYKWMLETTAVGGSGSEIEDALRATNRRVMVKVVWPELDLRWLRANLAGCSVLYCRKPFDAMARSWRKPTSLAQMEHLTDEEMQDVYNRANCDAALLEQHTGRFIVVDHPSILTDAQGTVANICNLLGVASYTFDCSRVSCTESIKDSLTEG